MATAMSRPKHSPLAAVIAATQNSVRPSRHSRTISPGLISPSTATTTMQPSVASGRSLSTPPRNSAQPTANAAVTISLSWVTEPAPWLIAVWENPPAEGIARNSAPATQASPLAASSWSLSIDGSSLRRTLWATAAVSRKHMMAMANAPGASPATLSNDGPTGVGSPDGTGGMRATPCSSSDVTPTSTMPSTTASNGAGIRGTIRPEPEQHGERGGRERHRGPAHVAEIINDPGHLAEEARGSRVAFDSEQLGQLAGGDGEADTDLDPGQRRLGDVVDQGTEMQQPCGKQNHADEHREHRQVADRIGSLGGNSGGEQRRSGEQGHRRRRTHRQCAGPPEQGVDDHRHHARVQPDLDREVGDRGVGHRLGDHHRPGGQPTEQVPTEPPALVVQQPAGRRHVPSDRGQVRWFNRRGRRCRHQAAWRRGP